MRRPVQVAERALAGYFGASTVYARVPLHGETVRALQELTTENADATTRAQLFPSLSLERQRALMAVIYDETQSPQARATHNTLEAEPRSLTSSSSSSPPLTSAESRLHTAALRATAREAASYRMLTSRFASTLDSNKVFGMGEEITYDDVVRDVSEVWTNAVAAIDALRTQAISPRRTQGPARVPRYVIFVVAYAHTHGFRAVESLLRQIQERTVSSVHGSRVPTATTGVSSACASVLRVVPITVGAQQRQAFTSTSRSLNGTVGGLTYPRGGLYTLNSVLHSIQSLPTESTDSGDDSQPLQHHTFIISEGWLHPRTMALLNAKPRQPSTTEVVPGVVSDALSDVEVEAFARYIVSRIRSL